MKPVLFQSRPDGEYRRCSCCASKGYGDDAWQPANSDFWPVVKGRLWFGRCSACCTELASGRRGVVPASPYAMGAAHA